MNLNVVELGHLHKKLEINIEPSDYLPKFETSLKDARKNVQMNGFRKGQAPINLVKKMYGVSVLSDQLNKTVDESVNDFIKTNNIQLYGQPLIIESNFNEFDLAKTYQFAVELGIQPSEEVVLPESNTVVKYEIEPSSDIVENQIEEFRKRFYENPFPEKAEAGDVLFINFEREGTDKKWRLFMKLDEISDEKQKAELTGVGKTHNFISNLNLFFGNDVAKATEMLKLTEGEIDTTNIEVKGLVTNVLREGMAELNQDFFNKLYGEGEVSSVEEMREKVKTQFKQIFVSQAEEKFADEVYRKMRDSHNIELPEGFLKKWLDQNSKNQESVNKEGYFEDFLKGMKYEYIVDRVLKQQNVEVEYKEIFEMAEAYVEDYFRKNGYYQYAQEQVHQEAEKLMKDEGFFQNMFSKAKDKVFVEIVNDKVIPVVESIDSNKFEELLNTK